VTGTGQVRSVLDAPARVVLPLFEQTGRFWGDFLTDDLGNAERWLGIAVLLGVAVVLRRWPPALAVWAVGSVGHLALTHTLSLPMYPRQLTILWVTLLAAVWMAGSEALRRQWESPPAVSWRVRSAGMAALLAGVVGVVWPIGAELRHPFSGGEDAAAWIRQHSDETPAVYCASEAPACSSVAIRLDEPAYSSSDGEPFSYVVWRKGWRRTVAPDLVAEDSRRLGERLGRAVVVVAHYSNHPAGCDAGWVSPPTIVQSERLVVCFADDLPTTGQRE
jgi:hypothetical protein